MTSFWFRWVLLDLVSVLIDKMEAKFIIFLPVDF